MYWEYTSSTSQSIVGRILYYNYFSLLLVYLRVVILEPYKAKHEILLI